VSTTSVTDAHDRTISSTALPWSDIPTPDGAFAPEQVRAVYHGSRAGADGVMRWVVNAWVTGRRRGKTGRKVGDVMTLWYLVSPDQHPDERAHWPAWLVAWLEKYHPARGGLDLDPTGSYL
jgi:hypothetical protein